MKPSPGPSSAQALGPRPRRPNVEKGTGGVAASGAKGQPPMIRMDKVPVVAKGAKGGLLTAQEIPNEIIDQSTKPPTKYIRGRFLGKGGFAKCYEVTSDKFSGILACKIVNKNMLVKTHHRDKMVQEIMIHRTLQHPNIVGFHTYFEDDLFVYIVLELCEKKSLMELSKRRKTITEPEAKYFLQQICEAVKYLHDDKKIIHRDLKLGNIFISDMRIKVGDFGLASYLDKDGTRKRTLCGTPNYIAPEVLNKTGHGFEVDIWSIGCVLYTLLIGRPPFETDSIRETYRRIKEGDFRFPNTRLSTEAKVLIKRMLQVDPSKRPSARQILKDDFLKKGFIPEALPATALTMCPRFSTPKVTSQSQRPSSRMPLQDVPQPHLQHVVDAKIANAETVVVSKSEGRAMMDVESDSYDGSEDDDNTNPPIYELMESLKSQLQNAVAATNCHGKPLETDEENEVPSLAPMIFVVRWVDYSDKYGFGYQLTDDSIGVSFNDRSKIILYADGAMTFITKTGEESHYDLKNFPQAWEKKVRLIKHFQQYMSENLLRPGGPNIANLTCSPRVPNLYTWFRTSKSVVMCLGNGTVQINNFRTHRKIILCPVMGAISVIEQSQPLRTFSLSQIVRNGCTEALKDDLLYSLGKLETICQAAAGSLQPNLDPIVVKAPTTTQGASAPVPVFGEGKNPQPPVGK